MLLIVVLHFWAQVFIQKNLKIEIHLARDELFLITPKQQLARFLIQALNLSIITRGSNVDNQGIYLENRFLLQKPLESLRYQYMSLCLSGASQQPPTATLVTSTFLYGFLWFLVLTSVLRRAPLRLARISKPKNLAGLLSEKSWPKIVF